MHFICGSSLDGGFRPFWNSLCMGWVGMRSISYPIRELPWIYLVVTHVDGWVYYFLLVGWSCFLTSCDTLTTFMFYLHGYSVEEDNFMFYWILYLVSLGWHICWRIVLFYYILWSCILIFLSHVEYYDSNACGFISYYYICWLFVSWS